MNSYCVEGKLDASGLECCGGGALSLVSTIAAWPRGLTWLAPTQHEEQKIAADGLWELALCHFRMPFQQGSAHRPSAVLSEAGFSLNRKAARRKSVVPGFVALREARAAAVDAAAAEVVEAGSLNSRERNELLLLSRSPVPSSKP